MHAYASTNAPEAVRKHANVPDTKKGPQPQHPALLSVRQLSSGSRPAQRAANLDPINLPGFRPEPRLHLSQGAPQHPHNVRPVSLGINSRHVGRVRVGHLPVDLGGLRTNERATDVVRGVTRAAAFYGEIMCYYIRIELFSAECLASLNRQLRG